MRSGSLGPRPRGDRGVVRRPRDLLSAAGRRFETRARPIPGLAPAPRRAPSGRGVGWLVFLFCAAAAVGVHAVWSGDPLWTVGSIEVEGNRSIGTDVLLDRLGLSAGIPWWRTGRADVAGLLAEEPRLLSVRLRYGFPRRLKVRVEERRSVLCVLADPPVMLSEDGIVMEHREGLDPADLPILTGRLPALHPGDRLVLEGGGSWREQLMGVRRNCPNLWESVSEVQFLEERAFRIYFRDGRRMLLWDPALNARLWPQIPRILAGLRNHDLDEDIVLDMRFRDRVVVRYPEDRSGNLPGSSDAGSGEDDRRAPASATTLAKEGGRV